MELKNLIMDNGSVNNGKIVSIQASKEDIEHHAKKFFNWKSSTKRYDSIFDRLMAQGSSKFDKFILYMHEKGY